MADVTSSEGTTEEARNALSEPAHASSGISGGKIRPNLESALEGMQDGASVMVGGFGLCGNAEALIAGVVAQGIKGLTLMSNNAGNLGKGLAAWLRAGIVERVICTYVGNNEDLHAMMRDDRSRVEIIPQGTFVERMRAGGAGIPAFYTPTGVGTVVSDGKEVREFDGREYVLEKALSADYALIRAHLADPYGNLRFFGTARNFSPVMATAAKCTIVEADNLTALGGIPPDDVHLPGAFVQRILHVPEHEDHIEYRTVRPRKDGNEDGRAKETK